MANGKDSKLGKPLIKLTTNFKSLKSTLVSDTTGKTLGRDPYVPKSIPNHRVRTITDISGTTSTLIVDPDPPAADGIIQSRIDDLTRFRKLALDKPGQKFAINQALLGQNPLQIAKTAASILAQVPVNGTGTHFINGFVVDTYLQKDAGQGTALGRFLASNLGINNLNGAGRALQGKQIITDNEGQKNYRSQSPSKLEGRNSKFDLTPGSDQDDFISPLLNQYLRSDIVALGKSVANTVKGLFSKNQKDKQAGKNPDLANIFKANPDNLGQEGFRTEKEEDTFDYESIKSNLKGPENPDKFVQSGLEDVEGRPLIKGTPEGENAKIISDNDGGRGFTPNALSFLEKKESTQNINIEGQEKPLKPDINVENDSYLKKGGLESGRRVVATNRGQEAFNSDQYAEYDSKERLLREEEARSDLNDNSIVNSYYKSSNTNLVKTDQEDAASAFGSGVIDEQTTGGNIDGRAIVKGTRIGNAKIIRDNPLTTPRFNFPGDPSFDNDFIQSKATKEAETEAQTPEKEYITDYTKSNIEVRLGLANGESPKNGKSFIGTKQSDYINSLGITPGKTIVNSTTNRPGDSEDYLAKDIIPFEIVSITPNNQTFLYFRAFLDDFSDNYSGEWSGNKYIGRAEEFYTYQGFKRDISFSFKIAAFSKGELIPLYRKLNYLAATTAPTYNAEGSFMRGTLSEITLGDYLYRQEGFISKVGLSWNTTYQWELDLEYEGKTLKDKLPKVPTVLDVSVNFTPIHKFNPVSNPNLFNGEEIYMGNNLSNPRV